MRIRLEAEEDVVAARRKARAIAAGFGFSTLDQTRIASAVSEIARNAFEYAFGGEVTFAFDGASKPQALLIDVRDQGPGIRDLESVLDGTYRSSTGMGRGIAGSRRLMDRCDIESSAERGTAVAMARFLPRTAPKWQRRASTRSCAASSSKTRWADARAARRAPKTRHAARSTKCSNRTANSSPR
ncbi:ATP-binding protein [Paraburkholderia sp. PGU19]|uniref:ATP-binding protein n=1 Tax=Paraburkholderia sp. PGU19 TaxID=2735434 RepID=UPI001FB07B3F|nr:ATP-binding protein [Paraburkholderia sp. PGU19]